MTRWLLIASVALNIFLLSFIIGDFARPIRAAQGLSELGSHYPDAIRRDLRSGFLADRRAFQQELAVFNETRAELFAVMRAPEFDRDRAQALMAEVRVQTTKLQMRLQTLTLAAVEAATPETRALIETPQLGGRALGFGED